MLVCVFETKQFAYKHFFFPRKRQLIKGNIKFLIAHHKVWPIVHYLYAKKLSNKKYFNTHISSLIRYLLT